MRFYRSNSVFYAIITIIVLLTSILVYTGDTKAATAQNTACIGAAEYVGDYQMARQALAARAKEHEEIYSKDAAELTADDLKQIKADFEAYLHDLAAIDPPDAAREAWAAEIALWATFIAYLDAGSNGYPVDDLNTAGGILSDYQDTAKLHAVQACTALDAIYGDGAIGTI